MNKSVRIFIACAVGAFVGSIIALQMYQMFWWLGAAIGAFVAYLGYNVEEVIAAIPVAYHTARGWQPDYPAWRVKFKIGFATVGLVQTMLLVGFGLLGPTMSPGFWLKKEFWGIALGYQVLMFVIFMSMPGRDRDGSLSNFTISYWDTNPINLLFWHLPRGLFFGSRWLILGVPRATMACIAFVGFSKNFTTMLLRLIHSELRLLCAVDAALGTAIGYFAGNPLIGAIAGGLLGVLNYEIITVRVMKLAGAKSMFR